MISALRAASLLLDSAPWESVVGWLGVLLRMGTEVMDIVHDEAQKFMLHLCRIALSKGLDHPQEDKYGKDMTPRELVLWVGMSLSDQLQNSLRLSEDGEDRCVET